MFSYSKLDVSYTLAPFLVWTDIEICAGIISACLPTLRPIVSRMIATIQQLLSCAHPTAVASQNTSRTTIFSVISTRRKAYTGVTDHGLSYNSMAPTSWNRVNSEAADRGMYPLPIGSSPRNNLTPIPTLPTATINSCYNKYPSTNLIPLKTLSEIEGIEMLMSGSSNNTTKGTINKL